MNFHLLILSDYLHLTTAHWAPFLLWLISPSHFTALTFMLEDRNLWVHAWTYGYICSPEKGIIIIIIIIYYSLFTCKRFFCCYLHIIRIQEPHAGHRNGLSVQWYSPGLIYKMLFLIGWNETRIHFLPTKMSTFQLIWWWPLVSVLYGSLKKTQTATLIVSNCCSNESCYHFQN